MVEIQISYEGKLCCSATHEPSGAKLFTDAPRDNHGEGQSFSPTDLVATALGTCLLTIMGIVAQKHDIDLSGATVHVTKEMATAPIRRIASRRTSEFPPWSTRGSRSIMRRRAASGAESFASSSPGAWRTRIKRRSTLSRAAASKSFPAPSGRGRAIAAGPSGITPGRSCRGRGRRARRWRTGNGWARRRARAPRATRSRRLPSP